MITRFDTGREWLVVESRHDDPAAIARGILIWVAFAALAVLAPYLALRWFAEVPVPPLIIGMAISAVVFGAAVIPRIMAARERIEVRGTRFVHERFVGQSLRQRDEYDLLRMKGLRQSPYPQPTVEGEWPGLEFWYVSGPRWFGDTLAHQERERVLDALIALDRQQRTALGMDADAGLADLAYWTSQEARAASLQELYSDQRFLG